MNKICFCQNYDAAHILLFECVLVFLGNALGRVCLCSVCEWVFCSLLHGEGSILVSVESACFKSYSRGWGCVLSRFLIK